jgi:ABC-type antimicrobial peptide transport system permease subunit
MTMATFERTREFGVMASLGTRRRRLLMMVLLEAVLQGVIGFFIGLALAWALLHGVGTADLSGLTGGSDVLGTRLPDVLRLSVHPSSVPAAGIATVLTMLAGGLLPAIRASRFKPVEATRYV